MRSLTLEFALFLLVSQPLATFAADICASKQLPAETTPVAMNDIAFATSAGVAVPVLANDIPGSSGGALGLAGVGPCSQTTCTSITTSKGGQVTIQGSNAFYTPPAIPVADTFTYTIHDVTQTADTSTAKVDILVSGEVNITYSCTNGNCSFTAHPAITTEIKRYLWTWGDQSPNQPFEGGRQVSHAYATSGSYDVLVTVEYWDGHSATGHIVAAVSFTQNATWTLEADGMLVTIENFEGLATFPQGGEILVNWSQNAADCNEGCGPLSEASSFVHVGSIQTCQYSQCWGNGLYKRSGTYSGTVRFTNSAGPSADYQIFVTVENRSPRPVITFSRPDPNARKIVFTSDANDDGPFPLGPFEWDFGDATTLVDPDGEHDPSHTYTNAGTYDVSLKIRDGEGRIGIGSTSVPVANTPPVPVMTVNCQLLDCTFTADPSIDDGNSFSAFLWNFGDGTTATTAQATKRYTAAGCRDVTLTLTDSDGASTTIHQIVPVGASISGGPAAVVVDAHVQSFVWNQKAGITDGNLNGILETGETVVVEPTWQGTPTSDAVAVTAQTWTSTDYGYAFPEFRDFVNSYDLSTGISDCWSKGRCYAVKLSGNSNSRNTSQAHNDVTFQERYLSSGGLATPGSPIRIHVGSSFTDVPKTHWAYPLIESALHFGVAGSCGGINYCPQIQLTRGQIASWILTAKHGPGYQPPACSEPGPFNDVPCTHSESRWIQQLETEGIVSGDDYTPDAILTRADLTVLLLRAKEGPSYTPPPCGIDFGDVQCPGLAAADWISEARRREISIGCSAYEYCPSDAVDRAQAAAMLVRTFGLRIDRTACPSTTPAYDVIPGHEIKLPIQSLTFTPSPVLMGTQATGTITVAWPTGAAVSIPLAVDNPAALSVPANVLVPSGQSTATFTVTGETVAVRTPTNVSARYFNHTKTTQLDVCTPPPSIITQPASQIIYAGDAATLTVTADGGGALTYQWYQGTAPSTTTPVGTNSSTLIVSPASTTSYWVSVTNACGSTASTAPMVTVCYRPGITVQPYPEFVTPGTAVTLSVTATGSAPLSYQWYEGAGGNISTPVGANSSTFTTPALTTNKSYWVRITSACNGTASIDSVTAPVTVVNQITRRQDASDIASSQLSITGNWVRPTRPGTLLVAIITASRKFSPVANFTAPAGWQHATTSEWTGLKTSIYYYPDNPGNRTTETFTDGGLFCDLVVQLQEYVGVLTAGALDKLATNGDAEVGADGYVNTGVTPVTSRPNELVVTGLSAYDKTEFSNPDYSFVEVSDRTIGWSLTAAVHERVVDIATTWGHTAFVGTNKQWVGAVATFKAADLQPGGCTAPPSITAQPASQTINTGQSATLSVTASGGGMLTYQWYQGAAPSTLTPVGSNSSTLPISPTSTTNYWVRVTNACGSAQSNTATVTVCTPPSIATQPASQTIGTGGWVTLTVMPAGSGPLSYQWFEGTSGTTTTPVGANSSSFTTPVLNSTKSYWVKVTSTCNGSASVDSNTATVTVTQNAEIVRRQFAASVANSQTSITTNWTQPTQSGSLLVAVISASSNTGYPVAIFSPPGGWLLARENEYGLIKTAVYYYPNNPGGRTSETFTDGNWFRDQILQLAEYTGIATTSPLDQTAFNGDGAPPAPARVSTGVTAQTTQPKELIVTALTSYTPTTFSQPDNEFVEIDDRLIGWRLSTAVHERIVSFASTYGHSTTIDTPAAVPWIGLAATFRAGTVDCSAPPAISAQPTSRTINGGQPTTLTVTATGEGALTYQWYQGTAPSTTTPVGTNGNALAVSPSATTNYWVKITNACGSVSSITATVTVCHPVVIATQPATQTIASGGTATFTVTAGGSGPFSYQWYEGASGTTTTPVGTNNSSFTTPSLSVSRSYWVRVTSTCNGSASINSNTATVCIAPTVVIQPSSVAIGSGSTTTLTAVPGGTGPFSYQWYEGTSGITTTPVGTNSSTFTTPALTATKSYWVRVTSACGGASANSNTATITVCMPPGIATQPASQTINSGATATLTVTPSGSGPFSYQWYEGASGTTTTPLGTNSNSFTTPALSTTKSYWVRVTSSCNGSSSINSNTATVTVVVCNSVGIATQPASRTINSGATATLSVTPSGSGPFTYQWYEGASGTTTSPVGTNSGTFITPALTTTKSYWVRVTSACNGSASINSNTATVTVCAPPGIATQPASQTINSGATATLSVTPSGSGPFSYQWYEGTSGTTTTPVGTNSNSFTTPALSTTKSYWVRVTSTCNGSTSVNSNTATVTVNVQIARRQLASAVANSQLSISGNWTQPTQAGSLLVAVISSSRKSGFAMATFAPPAGWQLATETQFGTIQIAVFYYPNNPGGRTAEAFTNGGYYRDMVLQLAEYTGIMAVSPLDKIKLNGDGAVPASGYIYSGVTAATSQAKELVITAFSVYTPTSFTSDDSAFVETHDHFIGNNLSTAVYERIVNTASMWGHYAIVGNPVAVPWVSVVVTFKSANTSAN